MKKTAGLYIAIIILGLLPTVGVFAWGIYTSVKNSAEPFVKPFEQMK